VPPKPRARTAAEMMSKLKLQAGASVTPVRAMSCVRAEQRERGPVPPKPRARTAAEIMSKLKLQAAASVTPVRAMSCVRAEQREAASAAQAEGENCGRDDEQAETAGGGERHARQGDELRARRAARGSQCRQSRGRELRPR
jgi:hypothetical protein